MKFIILFLLLSFDKTFGFIQSFRELITFNFSKYNITDSNCNDILEYAKTHNLMCVNFTAYQIKNDLKEKSFFQNYIQRFYDKNKEEINELFNDFIASYENFIELSNNQFIKSFTDWIFNFKSFVRKNRETIDYYSLSLITDVLKTYEGFVKIDADSFQDADFDNVHNLNQYTVYKPEQCLEKYNNVSNLTCMILSKNYYIMNYNGFMNGFLN